MFRIMLLGPVMKAVLRQFRIDRRRMAYIIDVSTEPIIVLLPAATAFVGFMTSVVAAALAQNDIHEPAYGVFAQLAVQSVCHYRADNRAADDDAEHPHRQAAGEKGEEKTNELHGLGLRKELSLVTGEPLHLFVPLALLLGLTFAFLPMMVGGAGRTAG